MTNSFNSDRSDCLIAEGTTVGISTRADMSDVQYGKFWTNKTFGPTERVKTFYGKDGALRWLLRLNNLYLIVIDRQVEWLAA
jgi:hypothetical protein